MLKAALFAVIALCIAGNPASAETGMGLIVDKKSKKIRRIDLQDDKIIHTTAEFAGKVKHARFAPDGAKLVYSDEGKKVHIADLDGKVTKTFAVWNVGDVSWTSSGIWVGGQDKVVLYDPATGTQKKEVKVPGYVIRVVSHSETLATARTSNPTEVHAVLLDQGNKVIHGGGGCSNVPSPSGESYTHNLWESGKQHQTMKIEHRSGKTTHYFYIFDLLPYPTSPDKNWTWNAQAWSSNSEDIIVIPAGRGYPQQTQSTVPWIYNLKTKKAVCLHANHKKLNIFWYIVDFYSGKVASGCTSAAQCDDKDPCTQDSCTGNKCQHAPISGCCTKDSQCGDGDPCTSDTCTGNKCQHSAIGGCCTKASQCGDGDPCTSDTCKSNKCQHSAISGCCTKDTDCDDGNVCTTDTCSSNKCQHAPVPGCCKTDGDCDDSNPCTADTCDATTGSCSNQAQPGCCAFDTDCDDGDPCTLDRCDPSNTCQHENICGDAGPTDGAAADSGGVEAGATETGAVKQDGGGLALVQDTRRLSGGCSVPAGSASWPSSSLLLLLGLLLLRRRNS